MFIYLQYVLAFLCLVPRFPEFQVSWSQSVAVGFRREATMLFRLYEHFLNDLEVPEEVHFAVAYVWRSSFGYLVLICTSLWEPWFQW